MVVEVYLVADEENGYAVYVGVFEQDVEFALDDGYGVSLES